MKPSTLFLHFPSDQWQVFEMGTGLRAQSFEMEHNNVKCVTKRSIPTIRPQKPNTQTNKHTILRAEMKLEIYILSLCCSLAC